MSRKIASLREAAAEAIGKGRYRRALSHYVRLEQLAPEDGDWPRRIAELHRRAGRVEEAVEARRRAAHKYVRAGFVSKAQAMYRAAIRDAAGDQALLAELEVLERRPRPRGIDDIRRQALATDLPRPRVEPIEVDIELDLEPQSWPAEAAVPRPSQRPLARGTDAPPFGRPAEAGAPVLPLPLAPPPEAAAPAPRPLPPPPEGDEAGPPAIAIGAFRPVKRPVAVGAPVAEAGDDIEALVRRFVRGQ
jgi:hypothetical protein